MARLVAIGADHGGAQLKQELVVVLKAAGYAVREFGSTSADHKFDYPDVAKEVCDAVLGEQAIGIVVCGTGIGISIAANKINGIRCALAHDHYTASMARKHNDANVLSIGGRTTGIETAKEILLTFLNEKFDGAHHTARLAKIHALE